MTGKDELTNRERFERALAGEEIRQPVYAVYDWFVKNRNIDWPSLFDQGLGEIKHAQLVECVRPHVNIIEKKSEQDGQVRRDVTWVTDAGELHEWYLGEWRMEYLIKTDADYRIMCRALSDSRYTPTNSHFTAAEKAVGSNGITVGQLDRTPMQKIQIDYAGLEKFSIDVAFENPQLLELMELMNEQKLEEFTCALRTDAVQIKLWENLSIETMGPALYRKYLVPFYRQILEKLRGTNKKIQVHYDGKLKLIADDIKALPFDGIDSLTPAPEGDLAIAEARHVWPDKFLWMHPTLGWFSQPLDQLAGKIQQMAKDAGPCRYCLMISEEVPPNWEKAVPLVLKMLKNLGKKESFQ